MKFEELNLENDILKALGQQNFSQPTQVQEKVIPHLLENKDIIVQAETGSGKTGAFVFPILQKLVNLKDAALFIDKVSAPLFIIITPTRELAAQIDKYFVDFGTDLGIKSAIIVGGENYQPQLDQLQKGVHVLTATPGRLKDLQQKRIINFNNCRGTVLDEADRLIDMGFKEDIYYLVRKMPRERQLMMFSATSGLDLSKMAYQMKATPVEVNLSNDEILSKNVTHTLAHVGDGEKIPLLVGLFKEQEDGHCLVFCNTKSETSIVAKWLQNLGFKALAISGDLPQNKRTSVLKDFREKNINILVCTDVAARGLDIKGVNLVINYDLPQDPASYVHRIGRTGRAGQKGKAISFCGHNDCEFLEPIEQYIDQKLSLENLTEDHFSVDVGVRPKMETTKNVTNKRQPRQKASDNNRNRPKQIKKVPKNKKRPEKKVIAKTERVHKEKIKNFKKSNTEATSTQKAIINCIKDFPFTNTSLLEAKIVEKGKRTLFGLGPRKSKYEVFVKTNFVGLANEFLYEFFQNSPFELNFKIKEQKEKLIIDLNGPDEEVLLNNDAEALDGIEYLVRKYIHNLTPIPKNFKVIVNCGDFQNTKESKLKLMADKLVKLALKKSDSVITAPLPPSDRFIIHQYLDTNNQVKTSSLGDGFYKKVKISLK
ncbi:MAG: DEAD/DEAH box helicase [Bacteriovoracaceae bacterium]